MAPMIDTKQLSEIRDLGVPALVPLLGDRAVEVLNAALSPAGGTTSKVRPSQVRYLPSKSITVQYSAEVSWDGGEPTTETMVAASGVRVPDGVATLEVDDFAVHVWRYPDDPFLPGLAAATDPALVMRFMQQFGVRSDSVQLRRRAYRPSRRAVIEATTVDERAFLKVVRPKKVASLQAVHTAMIGRVPVPQSLGWSERLGIVAMQAMPGTTLRRSLEVGETQQPHAGAIVELLDALPETEATSRIVPDHLSRIEHHARLLSTVLPKLSDRIGAVTDALSGAPSDDLVPVHGDFHASQILTNGSTIVGLVDVDTAGMGRRVDDFANLLGQIATVALNSPQRVEISRYGAQLIGEFGRTVDPSKLQLATAGAIFGFATGPFRVLQENWAVETERRIALCEQWIESALA
jgi:hypothetical protein